MNIKPKHLSVACRYLLLEPTSHHDAETHLESNASLYRRQRLFVERSKAETSHLAPQTDKVIAAMTQAFPVPTECEALFCDEPFERFVAIALTKTFITCFGIMREDKWGEGIFEGKRAYSRLGARLEQVAARVPDLKSFWGLLLKEMRVGISEYRDNSLPLFKLLSIPRPFHHGILYALTQQAALIVEMARFWNDTEKRQHATYAEAAGEVQADTDSVVLDLQCGSSPAGERVSIAVPHHSGNDIRHDIRESASQFLLASLDFNEGEHSLPNSVKALLSNGGNIAKGKTAGNRAYALTQQIREAYPLFGLLGGCTEGFLLGDSNLTAVNAFWEGREFNPALKALFGVEVCHSIMDALDTWTLHRHVTRHEGSPMPFSFEVVQAGLALYVHFQFSPYTTELEFGAFWTALHTFMDTDSTIGGNGAKGFGRVAVDILNAPDFMDTAGDAYRAYLAENALALKRGLCEGTLGTDTTVCQK